MRGECLDLGCGPYKAFPHFIGVDSGKDTQLFGIQMRPDVRADVTSLSKFSSGHFDLVYSSHTLEHIEDYKACLKEWWRLVKVGGHMVLYLPHRDFYPNCAKKDEWKAWYAEHGEEFPNVVAAVEAFADERRKAGETRVGLIYAGTPFANADHKHDFVA